jgi:hypothetical protein
MSLKEAPPSAKTMTSSTGMKDSHSKQHLATALRRALAKSGSGHDTFYKGSLAAQDAVTPTTARPPIKWELDIK